MYRGHIAGLVVSQLENTVLKTLVGLPISSATCQPFPLHVRYVRNTSQMHAWLIVVEGPWGCPNRDVLIQIIRDNAIEIKAG